MKMIKKNFGLIVLTAVIILLPIIAGLIMWNDLPEQIPTHWNAVGKVDGWSGKTFAVFGLPLFILAVHIVCILATAADPRNENIAKKPLTLVLWICPIISVLCNSLIYCAAFEIPLSIENIMPLFFGAQGTLGIISEVILKAVPRRERNVRVVATFKEIEPTLKKCFNIDRETSVIKKCICESISPTELMTAEIPETYLFEDNHYDIFAYSMDYAESIRIPISETFELNEFK